MPFTTALGEPFGVFLGERLGLTSLLVLDIELSEDRLLSLGLFYYPCSSNLLQNPFLEIALVYTGSQCPLEFLPFGKEPIAVMILLY